MKNSKERYWTFVMYPDSRPEDWKELLQQTGLKIAISPLHNKDKNPDNTKKKEHYHVLLCFDGPTTYKRALEVASSVNGTIPQRVMSTTGMIRYFSHKDNPEKAQYDEKEIIVINEMDIKSIVQPTTSEVEQMKRNVITIIKELEIKEYGKLVDYLMEQKLYDYLEIVSNKTIFFTAYLNSKRNSVKTLKDVFTNK